MHSVRRKSQLHPKANNADTAAVDARLFPFLTALAEALACELMRDARVPAHRKPKGPK